MHTICSNLLKSISTNLTFLSECKQSNFEGIKRFFLYNWTLFLNTVNSIFSVYMCLSRHLSLMIDRQTDINIDISYKELKEMDKLIWIH